MITERLVLEGENNAELIHQHLARYEFAKAFVRDKNVLDVACGSGYGAAILKQAGAAKVVGLDISEEALAYARTHFQGEGMEFVLGDAENLSSFRGFEAIVSFETIEHLRQPETFLLEITRALAPQGTLIISSPHRESEAGLAQPQNPFHHREWSLAEFQELLVGYFHGMTIHGQYNFEKKWFPYSRTLQRFVFSTLFPKGFKAIDKFPVLSEPPRHKGFQFSLVYMVFVCEA